MLTGDNLYYGLMVAETIIVDVTVTVGVAIAVDVTIAVLVSIGVEVITLFVVGVIMGLDVWTATVGVSNIISVGLWPESMGG